MIVELAILQRVGLELGEKGVSQGWELVVCKQRYRRSASPEKCYTWSLPLSHTPGCAACAPHQHYLFNMMMEPPLIEI